MNSQIEMDKCTFCAGGPEESHSSEEYTKYGANRLDEGKLPMCAEMCSTKALLAGDADVVSDIYRDRIINRGAAGFNVSANAVQIGIEGTQKADS